MARPSVNYFVGTFQGQKLHPAEEEVSCLLGGEVEKTGEALLVAKVVDAGKEALEAVEIGLAFEGEEGGLAMGASVVAALGDGGGVGGCVCSAEKMEAGLFEETLVFAARNEKIVADEAANGELFVGDDAGNDESIAEKEAAAGLENAEEFAKDSEAIRNMTHGVIGIDGVKSGVGEGEMGGRVVKEEGDAGL